MFLPRHYSTWGNRNERTDYLDLRDKRLDVADAIERLERQVDQHRADLANLEASMRLFDPNVEPETFQPTPGRRRNDWCRPGECRRRKHDVLRDAARPMTTREIVEGMT